MSKLHKENMRRVVIVTLLLLAIISFSPEVNMAQPVEFTANKSTEDISTDTITSFRGIKFTIQFEKPGPSLKISAENTNDRQINSSINIGVDGYYLHQDNIKLENNQTWTGKWNIEPGLNVLRQDHTVTVSTYGAYTQFNFTRKLNTTDPENTPIPRITDVEVANGTVDGEPSAVAEVTVVNPSIQTYTTKLMVHTQGTDGSLYPASVPPGEERTITVELLDERGTEIAGEARLYTGDFSEDDGAIDQVGFTGRAGDESKTWNESYEPVRAPWQQDSYEYENASLDQPTWAERVSNGYAIFGYPAIYPLAVLLAIVGIIRTLR